MGHSSDVYKVPALLWDIYKSFIFMVSTPIVFPFNVVH